MMAGAVSTSGATAGTRALLRNDARSLLPFWIAGVVTATVAGLTGRADLQAVRRVVFADPHALSLAACIAIIIGLGAQSLGHEYTNRTLGLLLALPVSRRRLFLAKHAVVAAMMLPLVAYMWLLGAFVEFPALPWVAAAAALGLAPLCTMIGRGPLAGAALSATLPAILLIVLTSVSAAFDRSPEAERAARDGWAWTMLPLLAVSAVVGWHRFVRLEALEGRTAAPSSASRPRAAHAVQPQHPMWLLLFKELRLQRMAFAMTMLYAALSALAAVLHTWRADAPGAGQVFSVASAIYWMGLPVLVGSLATAEERQLATLTWQLRLPVPAWQQWTVKAAVVIGVAPLLAVGAPLLVAMLCWPTAQPNVAAWAVLTLVTTAASLYVSSLCTSGMRAAIVSLTGIPLILWLVGVAATALGPVGFEPWRGHGVGWLALALAVIALLLAFSCANHRPEPPETVRVLIQLLTLGGLIATGVLLVVTAVV